MQLHLALSSSTDDIDQPAVVYEETESTAMQSKDAFQAKAQDNRCHFLSLPPELRNRIYELLLPTLLSISSGNTPLSNQTRPPLPLIKRVNHQIRTESLSHYYCVITIRLRLRYFEDLARCGRWFESLGEYFRLIKHFELQDDSRC